ncbi:hypothetical protein AB5J72_39565 [Streptomyces sp. CG1]|uniref:hypothetical protein n=1 Tax=Streptomyces sp. CG1 TaxID=1287523 RepID=UPI0034E2AA50
MQFVDVFDRQEIPTPPNGHRYLEFLGGDRQLRCYLVPKGMPRNRFMNEYGSLLDESLAPIYDHKGVTVRQDASYALPGFYIVALHRQYRALDEMDEKTHLRLFFVLREVRAGLRAALGVEHVHLYYEEKPDETSSVHYWVMPAQQDAEVPATVIMRLNLKDYLRQFRFAAQRPAIIEHNNAMRAYFQETRLRQRDDQLATCLEETFPSATRRRLTR